MKRRRSRSTEASADLRELRRIERKMYELNEKLLEKRPSHFGRRDIVNAFFASLLVGMVFIFKGSLFDIAVNLNRIHLVFIVLAAIIILTAEIYFIGYSRVAQKRKRPFFQFWFKRVVTLSVIAAIISLFLVYLFGVNNLVRTDYEVFKVVITIAMPCAVGAAVPSLLKQY